MDPIEFRLMGEDEVPAVHDLIRVAFDASVGGLYSREGIDEFYRYAAVEAIRKRTLDNCFVVVAAERAVIVGMVEMRNDEHVAMLFVHPGKQKRGIGRELLRNGIGLARERNPRLERVTVNSAPGAVPAYERFGFRISEREQTVNGITFVPMALDIW